jgi:DNA-directed RNA polymerase subunit K/omega
MLDKTPPTVVAFLEFSEGIVREISRFETAG